MKGNMITLHSHLHTEAYKKSLQHVPKKLTYHPS